MVMLPLNPSICIVEVSEIKGAYKFYYIIAKKAKHVQCTINILANTIFNSQNRDASSKLQNVTPHLIYSNNLIAINIVESCISDLYGGILYK